jgi:hypothetical protein
VHEATLHYFRYRRDGERELPHLTLFEMLMYQRRRHRDVPHCCTMVAGDSDLRPPV